MDREYTPEEALQGLTDLFSGEPLAPQSQYRKYFLEYQDCKPIFRSAIDNKTQLARSEIEVALDELLDEMFGNEIVPQKLAEKFPGSLQTSRCRDTKV